MCLAIPGRVVDLVDGTHGQLALVDVLGVSRNINIGMLEDTDAAVPGDWILIHMGFALSKIDDAEAARTLGGLELLGQSDDGQVDESQLDEDDELQTAAY